MRILPPSGPARLLAAAQLSNSVGDGAYYVSSALYFTGVAGLSPAQIGLGLTVAWAVGSVAGVPLGALADRRGPRGTAVLLALAAAGAVASFLLVDSFGAFLVAAVGYATAQCGLAAARQALLAGLVAPEERTGVLAHLQAVGNAGLAAGAAVGGLALHAGTREGFFAVFALDALTFLLGAGLLWRVPAVAPAAASASAVAPAAGRAVRAAKTVAAGGGMVRAAEKAPAGGAGRREGVVPADGAGRSAGTAAVGERRLAVLRDRPYALVTLLNAVLLLRLPLLSLVLPLWIVGRTDAPRWLVSGLFVLNTGAVMLFQVRTARSVTGLAGAARAVRSSGWIMLASCAVFALSAWRLGAWAGAAVLVAGAVLQVVAEMRQSAGGWQIGFSLAPAHQMGQYQGFFGTGVPVARTLGPLLLTSLVVAGGVPGWLLLGAVFLGAGYAMGPATRWAADTRPPTPAPEPTRPLTRAA
ncbi:MFS transporter [Streptomyces sp. NPDC086023]|uniref:MFS transporter n=1 Tax=Streptomyces sp. NPDC086023 TaxID=3365746 RepID=UPI0037D2D41B